MPGKSTASMPPPPPPAPSPPAAADDAAAASSHISAIISAAHAGRDAAGSVSSSHTVTTGKKPPPVPAEYLSLTLSSRASQSSSLPPNLFSPSSSAHTTPLVSECSTPAALLSPSSTRSQSAVPPPIPLNLMPPSSAQRPRSPSHSPPLLPAASSPTLSPTACSASDASFHLSAPSALTVSASSASSSPTPPSRSPPTVSFAPPGPPPPLPPRKPKTHSVQPSLSAPDVGQRAQQPWLSSPASGSVRPPSPSLPSLRSRISVMNKTVPSSILTEALRSEECRSRGERTPNSGKAASGSDDSARETFVSRVAHSNAFSSLLFSPPTPSSSPGAEQKEREKADERPAEKRPLVYDASKALPIIREMVDTESRFVDNMRTLVAVFIQPLQSIASASSPAAAAASCPPSPKLAAIVQHPQVQVFFSTATQILTLNSQFSEELSSQVADFSATTNVGLIFLHYAPLFRCYGLYASSHERVSAFLLNASRTEPAFRAFVTAATADGRCKGQTLESLLIMPIQRIPRYRLLLEELRKKMPDDHVGYADLQGALQQVAEAASHINESIRRREDRERLTELVELFIASSREALNLLDTDVPRRLVREGELERVTRRGKTVYYFHLLSELLLYSEKTVKGFKLHRRVELADRCSVKDRGSSDSEPFAILISSPQKSFVVCARSQQEKDAWLTDLTSCIAKLSSAPDYAAASHSLSRHQRSSSQDSLPTTPSASSSSISVSASAADPAFVAPLWTSDHSASQCTVCSSAFTFFNRRHHCRQCGVLVCSGCSAHRLLLPNIHPTDPQRVCNSCWKAEENAGSHCVVAGCFSKRERGPYCLTHGSGAAASTSSQSAYSDSPSSRHRGSSSILGRTRLIAKKPESSSGPLSAMDKHPFSFALPFPADWRDKLELQLAANPSSSRLPLVAELLTTELSYLADLHALLELYVKPLLRMMETSSSTSRGRRSEVAEIDGKRVSPLLAVFLTGVESLYDLSVEVAKQLCGHVEDWKEERETAGIGDVFVRYGSLFQLYLSYGRGWRPAMRELDGLQAVVKRLEEEAKRKMRLGIEREREREESRRESRRTAGHAADDDDDEDDPTAAVNHSARVSFDPAAIAKAALKAKKSRDLRAQTEAATAASAVKAAEEAAEESKEPSPSPHAESAQQPPLAPPPPLSLSISSSSPPPLPPKPTPLSLPDASPNPLSPSSPSTPISRNSASSRTAPSWLASAPATPSPESSLQALSSSPLHRLSHYVSMLSSLLSVTPASHPDHSALTSALPTIGSIQSQLVSVLTEAENAHRMQQLQSRFVGGGGKDWVRDGEEQRWMLQEGSAVRVKEGGGSIAVHLHLLSDALLVSEETAKGYRLLRWLSLRESQAIDQGRCGLGAGDGSEWRMQLISSSSRPLLLGLASDAVKADWLRGIKAAVKSVCEGGKKKPKGAEAAAASPLGAAAAAVSAAVSRSSSANQLAGRGDSLTQPAANDKEEEAREPEPEKETEPVEAVKSGEDEEKQRTEEEAAESSSEQQDEPHIIAVRAT